MYRPIIVIAISILVITGCYSTMEHPVVQNIDEDGELFYDRIYYTDDCAACHSVNELDEYGMVSLADIVNDNSGELNKDFYGKDDSNLLAFYKMSPWWQRYNMIESDEDIYDERPIIIHERYDSPVIYGTPPPPAGTSKPNTQSSNKSTKTKTRVNTEKKPDPKSGTRNNNNGRNKGSKR